jgi:flavorubredoxin
MLSEGIYWVGILDWKLRIFHGISTPKGGTYNSYLIKSDEIAIIDAVYQPFFEEYLRNLSTLIDPTKIHYLIVNHAEPDHSSSIMRLVSLNKDMNIVCTVRCKEFLEHMGVQGKFMVVKEGDTLKLGSKTLRFIEAPMLHWPETMWTFLEEEKILFPCDVFGTQVIESSMKAEAVIDIETHAKRYYAFIFRPLVASVLKGLEKAERLAPMMICPSHGPIWRDVARIQRLWREWSTKPEKDKVFIVYSSIWGDVDKMARAIADGVQSSGAQVVIKEVGDLNWSGWADLLVEAMESKAIAIGSLTVLGGVFPQLLYATMLLRLVKAKGKIGLSFGAYGWGPGITKKLDEELKAIEALPYRDGIEVRFTPTESDLKLCREVGKELGNRVMGVN